jgi:alpha-L-rhamnosidase
MKNLIILLTFILCSVGSAHAQAMTAEKLRCEYMQNPLGIDVPHPRFSWELTSSGKDKKQTAWQILVSSDPTALAKGQADDGWDSGKTDGNETNQLHYGGRPLKPFTYYYWRVRVWDEQGKASGWSATAKFSTGALSASDWKAQWIGDVDVPLTKENRYYPHLGYFCNFTYQPYAEKWIVIDLGETQTIDEAILYPADRKAKLFPLHFKMELSEGRDFKGAEVIGGAMYDEMRDQTTPYTFKLTTPAKGRYFRLTVTRLPSIKKEGIYEYGLAEIELLYQGKNLALNKPVKASEDKLEYRWGDGDCQWLPYLLTDGYYKATQGDYYANVPPSPLLRKEIRIGKKIKHALYHTSALGIYETYINGKKVSRQLFAPEWTDFDHHVQYQTHDITGMLQKGDNTLGVMLADGWYAGARWSHPGRGGYGSLSRKFLGQLVIHYEDGTSETIGTDHTWKYLAQGPVTQVTTFGGEEYDAKNDPKGWDKPGFDDAQWNAPVVYPNETVTLCAQLNEPIAVISEHKPVSVRKIGENKYIFDLGQNIVGWCKLSLPYNPGRTLTFRYAEVLNDDGTLYRDNLRGATQTDIYHPAENEKQINYEPRFTYHGFRFVEIEGLTRAPQLSHIKGKMVASSSPKTGTFATSNKDINKLWENIRWTQWGNMISVPTDCPQRDEREGWMGDAQVFSQTAIYNLDMAGFYTKWMRDVRDDQLPDGRLPDISPNDGIWTSFYNAPGWADAGVIIPWRMYQNYNDTDLLAKQYNTMKLFIDFIHRNNPDMLWRFGRGHMYGDWLNGNTIIADDYPKTGGKVPNDVYSTIYFAYSTSILAKTAGLLGKTDEYAYYSALADKIKQAFAQAYISPDGKIEGDTQAGYAMALEWGLIPEALRTQAAAHMVEAIKVYDYRISTGIHATIRLMKQLCEYGYGDIAYRLLTSRRFPSWFYSIDQGATTIWERWDGYVAGRGFQSANMNSFNHVAIGAVGEWMYSHILGIRPDESQPGYRHFTIKPLPGGGLTWAKGSYHAITGPIEVAWTDDRQGSFVLNVTVPPNTEATVVTPFDGKTHRVGSGKHRFHVSYSKENFKH